MKTGSFKNGIRKNIRKTKTSYTAEIRIGTYRTKPLRKTFPTKEKARKWKADQENILSMKKHYDPRLADMVTLKEALDKYISMITIEGSPYYNKPNTVDRKKASRKNLEKKIGKDTPLSELTADKIAAYRDERLGKDNVGASTVRNELSLMSSMMQVAKTEWSLPVSNPLNDVRLPKLPPGREVALTEAQAALVLSECKKARNKKFYPFILLLMHTGARAGEAAGRRMKDVDFKNSVTELRETKTGKPRTVPMTMAVREALASIPTEDYFFLTPEDLTRERVQKRPSTIFLSPWKHAMIRVKKADPEFPHITMHDIRHTAATHLIQNGVDIRTVADILGHSNIQMTSKYTHPSNDHKISAVNKIDQLGISTPTIKVTATFQNDHYQNSFQNIDNRNTVLFMSYQQKEKNDE